MATKTTPPAAPTPEQEKTFGPHHVPFSWLHCTEFDPSARLVETTFDVCRGVETCLEIVMNERLRMASHGSDDTDEDDRALLHQGDTERLLRLALAATRMLANDADVAITEINRSNRQRGK